MPTPRRKVDPIDSDANDYLQSAPKAAITCRRLMHSWGSQGLRLGKWHHHRVYVEVLRCDRCGTERHDSLHTRSMETLTRQYVYADGYQSNTGAISRQDVRKFFVSRAPIARAS